MKFVIRAYKAYSESARLLADKLGAIIVKDHGSKFRYSPRRHIVINWGGSQESHGVRNDQFINDPRCTKNCINKLRFFQYISAGHDNALHNVPIPKWTTDKAVAQQWLDSGKKVCARASLTGNSGEGLTIHRTGDDLPNVPLYVQYVPKTAEYRVHVFNLVQDEFIQRVVKKKLKRDAPADRNKLIRNHENGYIFSADVGIVPDCVMIAANAAINAVGLEFGAVDIGYDEKTNTCIVYEVNTAPGIEGSTVDWYADNFKKLIGE